MKVVVHPNVDLDAVACIAMLGGDVEVAFVPAGATQLPENLAGARVLDHPLGEKGRLDEDGTRHSALASMPESKTADPRLVAEIDEQDSTGLVRNPRFSLGEIMLAIKTYLSGSGLDSEAFDRAVIAAMAPIIWGINARWARKQAALEVARSINIVQVADFKVATPPSGEQPVDLGLVLNESFGCSLQIYVEGNNIGVFRYPGRNAPDLRRLSGLLPGWFIHSAGFLAAWGSKKSPSKIPPPQGTPQNSTELLDVLRKVFAS